MRGGRNKFGPMYKRDRARKLQVIRERQLTTSGSGGNTTSGGSSSGAAAANGRNSSNSPGSSGGASGHHTGMAPSMYAPMADVGYSPSGGNNGLYGVKHEIQIAQVSSLTSSPDSSPSPMTSANLGYPGWSCFLLVAPSSGAERNHLLFPPPPPPPPTPPH